MSIAENLTTIAENVPKVYEAGKKAEHNEFWSIKNYTDEKNYGQYMFAGRFWNKQTFKPTKDILVGSYTFYYHNWLEKAYDLAQHLEELGVNLIIHPSARSQSFATGWFSRLPVLDFSNVSAGTWDRTFRHPSGSPLVTIDKIILPPEGKVTSFSNTFQGLVNLKNITFEGVFDKSISFSDSPLSVVSMKSIISCLKDFSGTDGEYTYTVTFKTSAFNVLESEGATAEYNGVACTWAELIDNKKWNLVKG